MTKEKILEKLKELQKEIEDYSNYLENMTYHPFSTVDKFANELKLIINEIEEDL